MSYKTPVPPIQVFRDDKQQAILRRIHERLDNLEQVTQSQASDSTGRIAPAPAKGTINVNVNQGVKGHVYVRIVNPEFLGQNQNMAGSAIRHHLQACASPLFNSGVIDFGISHQTYYDISELGSGPFYLRFRSTMDGKTFNNFTRSQQVVIP